jgi:hypothetical protein
MYCIYLKFQSDVKGVYTKEEETATNIEQVDRKKRRMIERWAKILIPNISEHDLKNDSYDELENQIQKKLEVLNKDQSGEQERKFEIMHLQL